MRHRELSQTKKSDDDVNKGTAKHGILFSLSRSGIEISASKHTRPPRIRHVPYSYFLLEQEITDPDKIYTAKTLKIILFPECPIFFFLINA